MLYPKPFQKACLSLAYRSTLLRWNCLSTGDTLHSDLASSPPLNSASLGSNVSLSSINLLLCCKVQAAEELCSLPACAITTGADRELQRSATVIWESINCLQPPICQRQLTASPHYRARTAGGQSCPQIILFSLCPKLLWSSLPPSDFTLIAIISPISQFDITCGGRGKSNRISSALENLRGQSWQFEWYKWYGEICQWVTVSQNISIWKGPRRTIIGDWEEEKCR